MIEFISENWIVLLASLIGVVEVIVRLTPSDKDNSILNLIKRLIDAIVPNFRSGGGRHKEKTSN